MKLINSFFSSRPIFRFDEFSSWKKNQGVDNPDAMRKALYYHTKVGHLLNIRRGVYAVVSPHVTPDEMMVDPYLLAAKVASDSILAYHTALELHGVAYSAFEQFIFLTRQKIKPFNFRNQYFQPTAFSAMKKNSHPNVGVEVINRQGLDIQVTNIERTFVDVLDRVELSGGWEEVTRSIGNMVVLNVQEIIQYCLLLNNRILAAKVGYFLEQRQGAFAVSEQELRSLLKIKPLTPQSLISRKYKEPGEFIKKWNIVMPVRVIKKSWEGPNNDI